MLVIIPARGGSKGLPRKNILPVAGRPMIAYAIAASVAARNVDRTIVSTEDDEIADIARREGAEVPFLRPAELADDVTPSTVACLDAVTKCGALEGSPREAFALVQATNPLVSAGDIDRAIALFESTQASAVVSLTEMATPIESVFELDEQGHPMQALRRGYGVSARVGRRQDFPKRFVMCGAVTVLRCSLLRADPNYYYGHPDARAIVLEPPRGLDIDSEADRLVAEHLLNRPALTQGQV